MTKYILTNPKFTGCINLMFNEFNKLSRIEFDGDLNDKQYSYILAFMPITETGIEEIRKTFKVVKEVEEITFDDFYEAFGNKVGRLKAETVWNRMPKFDQVKAYMYITRYKTWLKTNSGVAQLHPTSYLNAKRWED